MAISNELFMAILAMDTYNRGYNTGIVALTGTSLGNATLGADSSILKDANGNRTDQAATFFAQSYTLDGQTIISYRGTDAFGGDADVKACGQRVV